MSEKCSNQFLQPAIVSPCCIGRIALLHRSLKEVEVVELSVLWYKCMYGAAQGLYDLRGKRISPIPKNIFEYVQIGGAAGYSRSRSRGQGFAFQFVDFYARMRRFGTREQYYFKHGERVQHGVNVRH